MARPRRLVSSHCRAARTANNLSAASKGPGAYAKRIVRRKALWQVPGRHWEAASSAWAWQVSEAEDLSKRLASLEERVPANIDDLAEFANRVHRVLAEVVPAVEKALQMHLSDRLHADLERLNELAQLFL